MICERARVERVCGLRDTQVRKVLIMQSVQVTLRARVTLGVRVNTCASQVASATEIPRTA